MKQEETCEICYKIRCRQCGWEPNDEEVVQIQRREMTACPICNWQPN